MTIKTPDIPYSLKISARARRVRLTVNPYQGLQIVIPKRFPRKQIPRILQQHEQWITAQLEKHRAKLQPAPKPQAIQLQMLDREITVDYRFSDSPELLAHGDRLSVGHVDDRQAIAILRQWIRQQASAELPLRLDAMAERTGFSYRKCIIRSQKSRWGSCSSTGTISLNDQLLFLPREHVDYLMLHELCHTRHMNHSAAFWKQVSGFEPDFRNWEHTLDTDRHRIPAWFMQSLYH